MDTIFRQGDVMIKACTKPKEKNLVRVDSSVPGRTVLAYGEVTGHHHSLDANVASLFSTAAGVTVLEVKEDTELTHQEHATIPLIKGWYEVSIQRQYAPDAIRRVLD